MWQTSTTLLQPGVSKLSIRRVSDAVPLTFHDFFDNCLSHPEFPQFITGALLATNYAGFFWEIPPLTVERFSEPFECVAVESDTLPRLVADPNPFSGQFIKAEPGRSVVVFQNLSGDATLLSPIPTSDELSTYTHLAAFLSNGEDSQISEFWRTLAETALSQVSATPVWISTAGLGVSWLHLRFDSRPKYYRHKAYKNM